MINRLRLDLVHVAHSFLDNHMGETPQTISCIWISGLGTWRTTPSINICGTSTMFSASLPSNPCDQLLPSVLVNDFVMSSFLPF